MCLPHDKQTKMVDRIKTNTTGIMHLTREEIHMTNKPMKRYSILLITKKIKMVCPGNNMLRGREAERKDQDEQGGEYTPSLRQDSLDSNGKFILI